MPRNYRIIIIVVVLVLISTVTGYYFFLKKNINKVTPGIDAVPVDAALIIEHNNVKEAFTAFNDENTVWKCLKDLPEIASFHDDAMVLEKLVSEKGDIQKILKNKSLVISLHQIGKKNIGFLFLLNLKNSISYYDINEFIKSALPENSEISERTYNEIKIHDISFKAGHKPFSYSFINGNLLLSYSPVLVESAIRQVNSKTSLRQKDEFKKIMATAGKNVEMNLFINYESFSETFQKFLNFKNAELSFKMASFADWTEADIQIKDKSILLNGFTIANKEENKYMNLFANQTPVKLTIESVIPANTSNFLTVGVDDFKKFRTSYKSWLETSGKIHKYNYGINKVKNEIGIDIEEQFYSFLNKEIAVVFTQINSFDLKKNTYAIFNTTGKKGAEKILLNIVEKYADINNIDISSMIKFFDINNEKYPVYKMPIIKIPQKLFGELFSLTEPEYFMFIDDYLIFGNSVESLAQYLEDIIIKNTLNEDESYQEFSKKLSSSANFYYYSRFPASKHLYSNYISSEFSAYIENNFQVLNKIEAFGLQFNSSKDLVYNNMHIQFNPEYQPATQTDWKVLLASVLESKPIFFTNHYTHENELFFQDLANNIYLVDLKGNILWSRPLDEKIMSDIYQIDIYKNNKLQLLFNTKSHIYLIDRNGKDVSGFPVRLKSPATNGIAVFDYDNDKDYRIFVATENRKIYLYSKKGEINKGWKFGTSEGTVETALQFVRLQNKDYIVFSDDHRSYILNRKGKERVKIKENFAKSKNNKFYLRVTNPVDNTFLATTDTLGIIKKLDFNGSVKTIELKKYSQGHHFIYEDLNGDGEYEYVFVDGTNFDAFDEDGRPVFTIELPVNVSAGPELFTFSDSEKKIGLVLKEKELIFLYNSDGSLYDGFPYHGVSSFKIGYLNNSFQLFVGTNEKTICKYEIGR